MSVIWRKGLVGATRCTKQALGHGEQWSPRQKDIELPIHFKIREEQELQCHLKIGLLGNNNKILTVILDIITVIINNSGLNIKAKRRVGVIKVTLHNLTIKVMGSKTVINNRNLAVLGAIIKISLRIIGLNLLQTRDMEVHLNAQRKRRDSTSARMAIKEEELHIAHHQTTLQRK